MSKKKHDLNAELEALKERVRVLSEASAQATAPSETTPPAEEPAF